MLRRWLERAEKPRSSVSSAQASRLREPMTLPTSSAFSGPAALNSTARGLPSRRRGHVDQVDRLVVHLALAAFDELVDEIAQPEAFGIDGGHGEIALVQADLATAPHRL